MLRINFLSLFCFQATQLDNPDKYALSTIVVSRETDWNVEPTAGEDNLFYFFEFSLL